MRRWAIVLTVLVLAGCHKKAADVGDAAAPAAAADAASSAKGAGAPAPAAPLAQLAYDYAYTLSLPGKRIERLFDTHQQACEAAGPAVCQVVGAALQKSGKAVLRAHLELRARPDWVSRFRAGLDGDAEAAGGQVESAGTTADDLSRAMVDNSAALKAKTGLRNRLEKDVETRSGKLSEAVEAEKTVAEVQGDIDTQRAELAAEKTQVATAKVTLDYVPSAETSAWLAGLGGILIYLTPFGLLGLVISGVLIATGRGGRRGTAGEPS